ncbi:MAG: DUF2281 domain-containing protein [Defluviitaleaceae bacterium]|nr:DUF2281 domain-containing protein [Defluviitaleaceae bacterium]
MESIKAIYNGTSFVPKEKIPVEAEYEVIITFVKPVQRIIDGCTAGTLPRHTAKGLLKGKIFMAEDFDEPLEEMAEYM